VPLLTPEATAVVAVAGAGVAVLGLLAGVAAHLRVGRLRRAYAALLGDAQGSDLVGVVGQHVRAVEGMRGELSAAQAEVAGLRGDVEQSLRHVAVVRYDAFGDMGGRLSFSAALLDDSGDGLVITSINGRSETRSYAKGVRAGSSEQPFSPEEEAAVASAVRAGREAGRQRAARPRGRHAGPERQPAAAG